MSLSDYIDDVLPGWMRRSSRAHWLALCNTTAHVIDAMIDGLYEGRIAAFPGQVDLPDYGGFESLDAVPFIARDRRLVRGPNETIFEHTARLRRYRALWRQAGTAALLVALRDYLVPSPPLVRAVSSAGVWWSLEEDGTLRFNVPDGNGLVWTPNGVASPDHTVAHPWDWDSGYGGTDTSRIWPIIYAPSNAPYLAGIDGQWGDGLSLFRATPDGTIGSTAPYNYAATIRGLVKDWKPAGIVCSHIIIAFDPDSFDPATPGPYPAAGMPDGYWKYHGKAAANMSGGLDWVRARNSTARYWKGPS